MIDLYFFKHLLHCLDRQKSIIKQSPEVQAEWQAVIDITYEQAAKMLEEVETEYKLRCAFSASDNIMEFEDGSYSDEGFYIEE
ncbi:hypothetical protein KKH23_07150 [Patescibacteria group bacterium]|nr:hypothetical protein [Patescibacteria group bacterium]MBU0846953.1 hypothetical protein [Patescibacteria group bacterium]